MNLFPCRVTLPDGTIVHTCRVVDDGDALKVYAWKNSQQGATVIAAAPTGSIPQGTTEFDAATDSGPVHVVYDARDCGCGHPMKRWRPPGPARVAATRR